MQGDWNHAVAEHEDVFDTHLLFLVDVIQPLSAYRIYSVENKATKHTDSARNVYFQIWLHITLLFPWHIFQPFIVSLTRALMPVLPQLLDTLLLLHECDDLSLIFCEKFFK